jgi:hypothetical protein
MDCHRAILFTTILRIPTPLSVTGRPVDIEPPGFSIVIIY